jgi:hypothetical protein
MARLKLLLLTAFLSIVIIKFLPLSYRSAIAQEYAGCFWTNPKTGKHESLEPICERGRIDDAIKAIDREQNPLIATGLRVQSTDNLLARITGKITNQSSRPIKLRSVKLQIIKNNTILYSDTVYINQTLKPGQSFAINQSILKSQLGVNFISRLEVKVEDYDYSD